jgi:hypothetical protein
MGWFISAPESDWESHHFNERHRPNPMIVCALSHLVGSPASLAEGTAIPK